MLQSDSLIVLLQMIVYGNLGISSPKYARVNVNS